ncbi:50S ribosomal protein L29, partial [Candidatus Kaiserbacteria bacterium RIFCSPHIGHO2_01_FULL_48_10]
SPEDLQKLLNELQADLREFRFGMSGGRTKNVKKARAIRADIARVHTILSEKTR